LGAGANPRQCGSDGFDFTVSGDPVQDSACVWHWRVEPVSLQAQYVPTNTVSASSLIDVTAWSGQQVELFSA